jgi:GntR family transcriptional regulator/MocR family aminotransferase
MVIPREHCGKSGTTALTILVIFVMTTPTLPFAIVTIDRRSGHPLHRQVYDCLRRAILQGMLRAGQRIPSTRNLAADLGVSRLPVLAAYEQLLHEGYLEARTGSGTFVHAVLPDDALRPLARGTDGRAARDSAAVRTARMPKARNEGGLSPFRTSLPALDAFPRTTWSRIVARHAHRLSPVHMSYGDPAGLPRLRAAIAEYLSVARALGCDADQVIIVSGSQAALRVCAAVLLRRGDRVAIEEPGYPGARVALTATDAELVPVGVDAEGLDVRALAELDPPVRAAYVTPSHQYPLGASMSAARRAALVDWAVRHRAWVIEDDYDSEFRYVSRPLGALQGMGAAAAERVIYVGTFSKVMFPALRVGYLVVPPSVRDEFIAAREALDLFSPTLYQLALTTFIRDGHLARHVRRMRSVYRERRDALLDGLARHCDGLLALQDADAGLHAATLLPSGVDDTAVVAHLLERGLAATALSPCYITRRRETGLLLGFAGFDAGTLKTATRTLGDVLRTLVR